ncbi:MAG: DUF1549 domain-containing protein, partial [Cyclobacteriaceae bacterium]|nr:DUF1549 domain-containing protein [Cyclobacteriaceae bacterium]
MRRIVLFVSLIAWACSTPKVDFSTEVKPILNKHCISCHGGVKKNGGFSLLFRTDALDTTESGKPAIIPGHAAESEMIRRLTLGDPEDRMPYRHDPLSADDINTLKRWIDEGAEWGTHWAYVPPKSPELPASTALLSSIESAGTHPHNGIDYFVRQKLDAAGLSPADEAPREVLLRRVSLDLTGVPPTQEEAQAFLQDTSPEAYEKLVDRLLASPRYGEKWAAWWLDMARYSDTKGYERDGPRTIWRYRDWVIRAFNKDMPFDQFTVEQLAGDLLPDPTDDQLIATAFHRNTMNNDEGGTEDEEFRVAALIDRVNTTWQVWQSTTMACVQCHAHPYDPFRQCDYYQSLAFFNNTRDGDTDGEHPNLRTYALKDQQQADAIVQWVRQKSGDEEARDMRLFLRALEPKYHPHVLDHFVNGELIDTKWLGIRHGGSARLPQIPLDGKDQLFIRYWTGDTGGAFDIHLDATNGPVIARVALAKTKGLKVIRIPLQATSGTHDLYFTFTNPAIHPERAVCGIEWFAFRKQLPGDGAETRQMEDSVLALINREVEQTPIMIGNNEEQHRTTHIFERGNWLVPGAAVEPDVPASLNPFPANEPRTRLGFARWLTSDQNPLTARTVVNRFWEQLFGSGLVETLEDFGTQGAVPLQPELLDWLSWQFMHDYHWSMKQLLRTIVLSGTYRQDSKLTPETLEKDPSNRYWARGPRVRLASEQVRDQALACSGLLSNKMFGKSVMPYQPAGIWNSVWSDEYWKTSAGEDQYRRSVYTYLKRTSPYPAMMTFD